MGIKVITYNNKTYPEFQCKGFAAQFAFPYAKQFCSGLGFDIGCMKEEWAFPGSIPVDISFDNEFHANNLPLLGIRVDYIFSSHCLEHIPNWVETLDYWYSKLVSGGTLFLYLPHYNQEYWRPWNNRKHLHIFTPEILRDYMTHKGYKKIIISECDLNASFMVVGEK